MVASIDKPGRDAVTYYKVKEGDSLYVIAKRFNVEMKHLQRWNRAAATPSSPARPSRSTSLSQRLQASPGQLGEALEGDELLMLERPSR